MGHALLVCGAVGLLSGCVTARSLPEPAPTPEAIVARADLVPSPWPGFEPRTIPVAMDDGTHTVLLGHPHPPVEVPRLHANTAVTIDGVETAGVLLHGRGSLASLAALVTHERFHVFERAHHPDWAGNEADLFVWPTEDAKVAALAELELLVLGRAPSACNARAALGLRAARHALLTPALVAYERSSELNEGLARHVERAAAAPPAPRHFGPDQPRDRFYVSGDLLAVMLDALAPGWPAKLEQKTVSLDELLAAAVGEGPRCDPDPATRQAVEAQAAREAAAVAEDHAQAARAFAAQPGTSVTIASPEPLWPQGFDPLNVTRVAALQVLHRRYLKLGNELGTVELERAALTTAVGPHPLMNGVRELTVTGLAAAPTVRAAAGWVDLEAEGLHAHLRGEVTQRGSTLVVTLRR